MKILFQEQGFRDKNMYKLYQMFFNDVGRSYLNSVEVFIMLAQGPRTAPAVIKQ